MRKLIGLAMALLLPVATWASTPSYENTDYQDWAYSAGIVVWRATNNLFHASTLADVTSDGTISDEEYDLGSAGHPWNAFARTVNGSANQNYTAPGLTLVFDKSGYTATSDAQFAPLSFGGLWVRALAAENTPYTILDNSASMDRTVELGATDKNTYFKFDASFTFNRNSPVKVLGEAVVEIADGATFTINQRAGKGAVVDADASLFLTGQGTLAVVGGLTVNGALDLSGATKPTISGDVTLAGGSTIILPANTVVDAENPFTICSGNLEAPGLMYVTIGAGTPLQAMLTVSNGKITKIDAVTQTEITFTSDYPAVVPYGFTYTYVNEASETATIPAVTVNGTLKTSGPITITDLDIANGADFEVVAGNTTVNCSADCKLKGNIKVDAGATLTNTRTDSLSYNHSMTVDIYGTLAMGTTRWSVPGGCTFKLHAGAQVTGAGDTHASLDFINGANRGLDVYAGEGTGSVTIEGKMRVRANETRIWIAENTTLVLASGIADGGGHHAGFKQVGPGTLEIHANSVGLSGNASIMTQGTLRLVDTNFSIPVRLDGDSSYLEVVATEAATIVPVNVWTANNNITFSGAGKVNGSIMKASSPSGNLAAALQSSAWIGTFVADWEGSHNTQFDINSYGNANSVVEVRRLVGGFVSGSNANVTVVPTVRVFGFMKLGNGYSGKITTLTKLTGDGVFTNESYSVDITTLDKFTGTLVPLIGSQYVGMRIGTINLSSAPVAGDKIVNLGDGANIGEIENTKVSVNGVVDESFNGKLEVKSDGIYVAMPSVTINVPAVANATATVTVNDETVEPTTPGGNAYSVEEGATVTVTYSANEGYELSGTTTYTIANAAEGSTITITDTQAAAYVAALYAASTTNYTTLQAAVTAAADARNSKIVLLGSTASESATIPAVDSAKFYVVTNVYECGTISYPAGDYIAVTTSETVDIAGVGEDLAATVYSVTKAAVAVTVSGERSLYMAMYIGDAVNAAIAGGLGSTIEFVNGTDSTPYVSTLEAAGFTVENDVWTFTTLPVAKVTHGVIETSYATLAMAFGNADNGDTITVLADNTLTGEIAVSKNLTLDLNGYTVTGAAGDFPMFNLGEVSFTITDTSEGKAGKAVSAASKVILSGNSCTFTLAAGTLESGDEPVFIWDEGGARVVNINGGKIVCNTTAGYAVRVTYGTVNMTAGEVDSACSGFYMKNAIVSGGTIKISPEQAREVFYEFEGHTTITVTGGTFNRDVTNFVDTDEYEVVNNGNGTYTVRTDKGWIYEASDYPGYTGSWETPLTYDQETGKARIEDGNTYTASKPSDGRMVTLNMTIAFDDACSDDEAYEGVKAAVRLGEGETEGTYVFQLYTSESGTAKWVDVAAENVTPTIETDYTFAFVLDMTNKTYTATVGGAALAAGATTTFAFASANTSATVQSVEFTGSGTLTSLTGSYNNDAPADVFAKDQVVGNVTLTSRQAAWLNAQKNYAALAAKIATMTATAFNDAYLLNLDILDEEYDGTYEFAVTGFTLGPVEVAGDPDPITVDDAVTVTVKLERKGALDGGINGILKLKGGNSIPASSFEVIEGEGVVIDDATFKAGDEATIVFEKDDDAAFYQPVIVEAVE